MSDYTPFTGRRPSEPTLFRIETAWQLRSPTCRTLDCGIYSTEIGIEVRMGYGENDPLYTRRHQDIHAAREDAAKLREEVLKEKGFSEAGVKSDS